VAVTSKDIRVDQNGQAAPAPRPPRGGPDWSLLLIKLAGWLAVAAFGGLFWMVNGGFSVLGLEIVAKGFGPGGVLFWETVSSLKLPWRFLIPGLPATQPAIPWVGCVAASLIQVGIVWRSLLRRPIPIWAAIVAFILSIYDLATTWFGLGTLQWVQWAGSIVQSVIAVLFTFGLELLIGVLLRRQQKKA
jgi:hypothetical protein